MSAIPQKQRVELSPAVRVILEADGQQSQFIQDYLRYMHALIAPDPAGIDVVATSDVRCHELEAMGLPPGREGLKLFRRQVNTAIPDEHITITAVSFEGNDIIEADLKMEATQTGELMGIPASGRKFRFDVHERCRFVGGKLAERWAQVDLEDIKRKLTDPAQ
jgi:predicted ester cyclase